KPFGCCGMSNATSAHVILALILVVNFLRFVGAMGRIRRESGIGGLGLLIYAGWSLLHALGIDTPRRGFEPAPSLSESPSCRLSSRLLDSRC
ncbi:hypothetical protein PENTCL1PPCAC_23065, partial [Pristionchus entomophagus]